MPKERKHVAEEWAPVLVMYLGMGILIFCVVFWAFTNRLEPTLLAAGGGLLGTSQGLDAIVGMRRSPPAPPPVPDTTVNNGQEA